MGTTLYILIFLYSLCVASFLNVVAIRIPKGESIIYPPSHCVYCHKRLTIIELVPLFSYLWLRGKCRHCHTKISPYYILGELLISLTITSVAIKLGFIQELWIAIPLICFLATISISDLLYQVIPDKVNLFFFFYFLLIRFLIHPLPLYHYLLGILSGGGLLLLLAVLSRGGMGGGDIKLMTVVGLALGWDLTLLSLFIASLLGTIVGTPALLLKIIKRGQPIPFGPFLAVGSLVAYLWGREMIEFYVNKFLL